MDLFFNPAPPRGGMLAWHRFGDIVEQRRQRGREVLAEADAAGLARPGVQADACPPER